MMTCALKLKQLIEDVKNESTYTEFHDTLGCTLFQDKLEPALIQLVVPVKKRDSLSGKLLLLCYSQQASE